MPPRRATVLLVATSTLACSEGPDPLLEARLLEPGVSLELATHRAATISDLRYEVDLTVPESRAEPVRGRLIITLRWEDPGRLPLVLDFLQAGERVAAVTVNGSPVEARLENDHIVVPASALDPGGEQSVRVDFTAGDGSLNRSDDFLYTLFVPDRARFALPVFDQPDLKGRYTLSLTIPREWRAVANGPEVEESTTEVARVVRFGETRPISTYLFAFAAGRFEVEAWEGGGRTLRMFHRETDGERVARNRAAIFELHDGALDYMEAFTGIPYPFQKFDFVAVPSFQYGGMEHPGSIFYRAESLFLEEASTQAQRLGRASLIAHETAHIWFGDLVTMTWFEDVWLKEVFANFMAAKIAHPAFPEIDHDLRFLMAHHPRAYAIDRTAGANPILQPLDNLREAGTLYGPIIYQKAPVVMKHLERLVGEEPFRAALAEYLDVYRFANARWTDLVSIVDARSNADVAAWSRVWVEEAGRPTVTTEVIDAGSSRGGIRVRVSQTDPEGRGRVWSQTLSLASNLGGLPVSVRLDGAPVEVQLPGRTDAAPGEAGFVLPNADGVPYGRFLLDDRSLSALLDQVWSLPSPLARGAGWLVLSDALQSGDLDPVPYLDALLRGVVEEPNEQLLQAALVDLQRVVWTWLPDDARARRSAEVEGALLRRLASDSSASARTAVFRAYRSLAWTAEGVDRMRHWWTGDRAPGGVELGEDDLTQLALELAVRGVPDADSILVAQQRRIENPDRAERFRYLMPAASSDPEVRAAFARELRDPARREREPWTLAGLGLVHHPSRRSQALPLILPALELLEEVQRTGDIFFPAGWVGSVLSGHNSVEAAAIVDAFLEDNPGLPVRLRAKVLQAAHHLRVAPARIAEEAHP